MEKIVTENGLLIGLPSDKDLAQDQPKAEKPAAKKKAAKKSKE